MKTSIAKPIFVLLAVAMAVAVVLIWHVPTVIEAQAQTPPRPCSCSAPTKIADTDADQSPVRGVPRMIPLTYMVHCTCGNLSCAISLSSGVGNELACVK